MHPSVWKIGPSWLQLQSHLLKKSSCILVKSVTFFDCQCKLWFYLAAGRISSKSRCFPELDQSILWPKYSNIAISKPHFLQITTIFYLLEVQFTCVEASFHGLYSFMECTDMTLLQGRIYLKYDCHVKPETWRLVENWLRPSWVWNSPPFISMILVQFNHYYNSLFDDTEEFDFWVFASYLGGDNSSCWFRSTRQWTLVALNCWPTPWTLIVKINSLICTHMLA